MRSVPTRQEVLPRHRVSFERRDGLRPPTSYQMVGQCEISYLSSVGHESINVLRGYSRIRQARCGKFVNLVRHSVHIRSDAGDQISKGGLVYLSTSLANPISRPVSQTSVLERRKLDGNGICLEKLGLLRFAIKLARYKTTTGSTRVDSSG